MRGFALGAIAIAVSLSVFAQEPICATGERTEQILEYLRDRLDHQPRERAKVLATTLTVKDGTFIMNGDGGVAVNGRSNDLVGKTIEFQPVDASHYAVKHVDYGYVNPQSAPLRDFSKITAHSMKYELQSMTVPIFGKPVSAVYLSAFNGIHFSAPADVGGYQIDDLHAFTQPEPILSPLLITTAKPSRLAYPQLFVEERDSSLIVTWRSESGSVFGYDVQARIFSDGRIDYSYRSARSMRWGAPVLHAGLSNVRTTPILTQNDPLNDATTPPNAALKSMLDLSKVEVTRVNDSDMLRVQLKLAAQIDVSKLAGGEFLRYLIVFGQTGSVFFDIRQDGTTQTAPIGTNFTDGDASGSYAGDTITLYVAQGSLPSPVGNMSFQAITRYGSTRTIDSNFTPLVSLSPPERIITQDLSAIADGTSLELPIAEPFTLPVLSPSTVWTIVKSRYPVNDNEIDAIAVYQNFYTDIVFYAGAYSASGNPQVDGIATASTTYGSSAAKRTNVMHLNTLGYGWNATDELSSHVIMHEFGHRWLYFIRIKEGDSITNVLNPVSAHPAQYISTPAAFSVYNSYDASVMGGGVFTPNSSSTFHVRAANFGYSWTDLYLMGFAAPEEVRPWFYVANSNPELGPEYYPPDQIDVSGQEHDVTVDQLIAALGPRKPAMAASPKSFRVLFVLVTDDGNATPAELAGMKKIRQLFEANFKTATGQRAEVHTDFGTQPRRRGVSH